MSYLQVYFNGELKFSVPLQPAVTSIGRDASNDLVIANTGVSGSHAVIAREGNNFYIEDMKSTNGVFVNGRRVFREQVHYGDEITIFKHKLKITAADMSQNVIGEASSDTKTTNQNQTMEVDATQLQAIIQYQQTYAPYLYQTNGEPQGRKWILSKHYFDIGKSATSDLRLRGWFTPKRIAKIIRQSDGFYLIPEKWGRVRLNGIKLTQRIKLHDLDKLQIRDMALTFFQPVATKPPPI
jgi:predicted component of type VI protein secretion system